MGAGVSAASCKNAKALHFFSERIGWFGDGGKDVHTARDGRDVGTGFRIVPGGPFDGGPADREIDIAAALRGGGAGVAGVGAEALGTLTSPPPGLRPGAPSVRGPDWREQRPYCCSE